MRSSRPMTRAGTARSGSRGFSMVEVLVSLVIIAVGMLGLAKIQALAYASTGVASQQSIAALEAASLASAMRANRSYWSAFTAAFSYSKAGSAAAVTTDVQLNGTYACVPGGASPACTPAQIAAYELSLINISEPTRQRRIGDWGGGG